MIFWNRDTNHLIPVVAVLFTLVVALPSNGHAQDKSEAYKVYDAENLDWLTKAKWGLQWVFVPAALNNIVPFYSYNLWDICSHSEHASTDENQGQVADSGDAAENADWGAILYKDVEAASALVKSFATSRNVTCPSIEDLLPEHEHTAIIGNWNVITAIEKGSSMGVNEDQDLFLAMPHPLSSDAWPAAAPRMFVGEDYNIGVFLRK